jgi:hypothetical protein
MTAPRGAAAVIAGVVIAAAIIYALRSPAGAEEGPGAPRLAELPMPAPASGSAAPAPAPAPNVELAAPPPAPVRMDPPAFWSLIDETHGAAGGSTEAQSNLLEQRFEDLPESTLKRFDAIRHELDRRAYTWDIWGAAYVIEDGCSDDCFQDFRAYLISLGRDVYERALRDPDSVAGVVQDPESASWESALDAGPSNYPDLDGDPRGEPWDDDQTEELLQRYPRLAERFR